MLEKSERLTPRLGVNIDHVATLRQARDENYPSIREAALISLQAGADQITIHLREDRRHIQDRDVQDVRNITREENKLFNFEMGNHPEMVGIAKAIKPEWVCLVPEKREERTTEGGLNLADINVYNKIEDSISQLNEKGIRTSLFVESRPEILEKCISLKADAVEIHTGDFAMAFNKGHEIKTFLTSFREGSDICKQGGVFFHAGHGLTLENITPLLESKLFAEYNVGHWIIGQAVFDGLFNVVKNFVNLLQRYPLEES